MSLESKGTQNKWNLLAESNKAGRNVKNIRANKVSNAALVTSHHIR